MKEKYSKPDIDVNAFTQFENVFTACNKNPGFGNCIWDPNISESGSENSHHRQILSPTTSY